MTNFRAVTALLFLAVAACCTAVGLTPNEMRARTGDNDGSILNFPSHYVDPRGLKAELCIPKSTDDLDNRCLFTQVEFPLPFVRPTLKNKDIPDEYFYWMAEASIDVTADSSASVTLALEGAFANGLEEGQQIVFGRIRLRLDNCPEAGPYTFHTPYGDFTHDCPAVGDRIFVTQDLGINCCEQEHWCSHRSDILAFGLLLPSDTPGGDPILLKRSHPYLPTDRTYAVTGSSDQAKYHEIVKVCNNPNMFGIRGPGIPGPGFVCTDQFSLMGKFSVDSKFGTKEVFEPAQIVPENLPATEEPPNYPLVFAVASWMVNTNAMMTDTITVLYGPMLENPNNYEIVETHPDNAVVSTLPAGASYSCNIHATDKTSVQIHATVPAGPQIDALELKCMITVKTPAGPVETHYTFEVKPKESLTVGATYETRKDRFIVSGISIIAETHNILCKVSNNVTQAAATSVIPLLPSIAGQFSYECRESRCITPVPANNAVLILTCTTTYDPTYSKSFPIAIQR